MAEKSATQISPELARILATRGQSALEVYAKGDDPELARAAREILSGIRMGRLDPSTGEVVKVNNAKNVANVATGSEGAARKKQDEKYAKDKQVKAWTEYDRKKQANDEAARRKEPLPYGGLKEPKFPRPVTAENVESQRLQAQVPKNARSSGSGETVTSDETLKKLGATSVADKGTGQTPPPSGNKSGNGSTGGNSKGGKNGKGGNNAKGRKYTIDEIFNLVGREYGAIDEIFKTDPELSQLLRNAVGKDGIPGTDDDWTPSRFTNALSLTNWWKSNAGKIRQVGFYKRQYESLKDSTDPEQLKLSEYGQMLEGAKDVLQQTAIKMGAVLTDEALDYQAQQVIDNNLMGNTTRINSIVANYIKFDPQAMRGDSLIALEQLRATAQANGVKNFDQMYSGQLRSWLSNIAKGESIEYYKQQIRNSRKIGLPENMQAMLDTGLDLDQVVAPYRNTMASMLELNPEQIDLSDPALTMAFRDQTMNLFDYQRALRRDQRWQYTKDARDQVYSTAMDVLKDFGFTG